MLIGKGSIELIRKEPVYFQSNIPKHVYFLTGNYSDFGLLPTAEEFPDIGSGSYCLFYTSELAVYSEKDDAWKLVG